MLDVLNDELTIVLSGLELLRHDGCDEDLPIIDTLLDSVYKIVQCVRELEKVIPSINHISSIKPQSSHGD